MSMIQRGAFEMAVINRVEAHKRAKSRQSTSTYDPRTNRLLDKLFQKVLSASKVCGRQSHMAVGAWRNQLCKRRCLHYRAENRKLRVLRFDAFGKIETFISGEIIKHIVEHDKCRPRNYSRSS